MWVVDDDGADDDRRYPPYVDGAWGRTANPNSVEGELQNMIAFGDGLARLTGPRRAAARIVVWLILIGVAITLLAGIAGIIGLL